jgi:hypothetical protein
MEDELEDDDAPPAKQQKVKDDRKLVRLIRSLLLLGE